jgi:hypothetical protein
MRTRMTFVLAAIGCLALCGSAMAQNPAAEAQWNRYLANHPNVSAQMATNPNYMAQHPGVAKWLQQHPDVASYARQQGQVGGWDSHNQWHNRSWWETHNPNWVHQHHPEWASNYPPGSYPPNANNVNYPHGVPYARGEGDYDAQHQWHDRGWWVEHNHPWVAEHHPNWFKHN